MDYSKHYELLIERARNRELEGYQERHHIVPRCLGGSNEKENLVDLTPEEHYVAHQLLVKLNPGHHGLAHAAHMMTVSSKCTSRNNKSYGWLRKKHSSAAKQRIGEKNGSFGKKWCYDPLTLNTLRIEYGEIPEGWMYGRPKKKRLCVSCKIEIHGKSRGARYCESCRKSAVSESSKNNLKRAHSGLKVWLEQVSPDILSEKQSRNIRKRYASLAQSGRAPGFQPGGE